MSTGILSARVRQGIALMDLHHGPEWVWKVDPDRLDIDDSCHCVLGQVAACKGIFDYLDALHAMGIGSFDEGEVDAGFLIFNAKVAALTRIWAFAIRRLREQRPQAVA